MSTRFGNYLKQLEHIEALPSKKSLLQLQMERCQSIAELLNVTIEVIVMISDIKDNIMSFLVNQKYSHLNITTVSQYELGVLTENGKVIMDTSKSFAMFPNGTGDFLSAIH